MNQSLYLQLKKILANYTFDDQANFYKLFKFARLAGLHGLSFRQFSSHAKAMGVSSSVQRVDGVVQRSLSYDAKADEYIKVVFPTFETCQTCKGSGMVEIKLT